MELFQRLDDGGERGLAHGGELVDTRAIGSKHFAHGGLDVLRSYVRKRGERCVSEQWVVHGTSTSEDAAF